MFYFQKNTQRNSSLLADKPVHSLLSLLLRIYLSFISSEIFCIHPHKPLLPTYHILTTLWHHSSWIGKREIEESCDNYWYPGEYPVKAELERTACKRQIYSNKAVCAHFLDLEARLTGSYAPPCKSHTASCLCGILMTLSIWLSQLHIYFFLTHCKFMEAEVLLGKIILLSNSSSGAPCRSLQIYKGRVHLVWGIFNIS